MQLLVVYYSGSGMTRRAARVMASTLRCDTEEIVDLKNTGKDAFQRKLTEISEIKKDPARYEVVLIGTPALHNTISSAIRTYIHDNKERFGRVAFFCSGGVEDIVFKEMECICGKTPITTLCLEKGDMKQRRYVAKAEEFATDIPASMLGVMLERIDRTRSKASSKALQKLRGELDRISEVVTKIPASVSRKRVLEEDVLIAYDLLDSSIFKLEQARVSNV